MTRFEIQVVGHIGSRWARALGAETCLPLEGGRSALVITAVDAAATYGLIARLRDAGLELISITPCPDAGADTTSQHRS